jgi:hypothetical protein
VDLVSLVSATEALFGSINAVLIDSISVTGTVVSELHDIASFIGGIGYIDLGPVT